MANEDDSAKAGGSAGDAPPKGDKGEKAARPADPLEAWHTMLGEMERGINSFANQAMSTPEFSRVMNQASGVATGLQKRFSDTMEKYLVNVNLPSRVQMSGFGERLQAIETQLIEIKMMLQRLQPNASGTGEDGQPIGMPRPPRTRTPAPEGGDSK